MQPANSQLIDTTVQNIKVDITLRALKLHLGRLTRSNKWHEQAKNTSVVAYLSPNCNGESDEQSCKLLEEATPVQLSATCFKLPNPSCALVFELLCTVETAELKTCKHLLGRGYVKLSSLKQKSSNSVDVKFKLPREAWFTAGVAHCDVTIRAFPGFDRSSNHTWYVGKDMKKIESIARHVSSQALNIFFDSKLMKPLNPALHSFHCPYTNDFLPGGFFSQITPVCSHQERHMQLCLQYGVDTAELTMDEFTRRCEVQLESMGQLNHDTIAVLRAIASAAVISASVAPYCVDHTLKGKKASGEGGLGAEVYDCCNGQLHGAGLSGGDCEDKGCSASVWINCLISGPGHRESVAEWSSPALKAAARLIDAWYRPCLTIWAVATAALQGAASASQGNGFACHINAVLLPRRVMSGSGIATLKDDAFSTCVCPPDLPPLMLEGTGYLDPVCTPGMVADRGESSMNAIKAMQTETSLFDESVAHALMPRQFVHRDGSVSFYKYAVHCYSTAYKDAMDFYYCARSGTYGVEWNDFVHGKFNLVPQYVYKDHNQLEQLQDACNSQWAPSSLHAGMPSAELEQLLLSKGMNWGTKSDKYVELLGNANDIERIVPLVSIKNLNVRHEEFYPVGIRTSGYAFSQGTQLVRILVYLK